MANPRLKDKYVNEIVPALSNTARIAPPAITPVPVAAGFRRTNPPLYFPIAS